MGVVAQAVMGGEQVAIVSAESSLESSHVPVSLGVILNPLTLCLCAQCFS